MSWEEELQGITIGTLFKFYGKNLVASILWIVVFYLILMIPFGIMMAVTMLITNSNNPVW